MENYLWGAFAKATSGKRDRLLALVNYLPLLTVSDIIRCAFDDEALYAVTLRLHEQAREEFKKGFSSIWKFACWKTNWSD